MTAAMSDKSLKKHDKKECNDINWGEKRKNKIK